MQTIEVRLDPDAEVVEKLCRDHEVRIYPNALGTFTAAAGIRPDRSVCDGPIPPSRLPDDMLTDDDTPVKALVRLAYKMVFRRIVTWAEQEGVSTE